MDIDVINVDLQRGDSGLGFNIRGGIDAPYIPGDHGIFITKIRQQGAAADDGRLEEGDKILEINGYNVQRVTHAEAVALFQNSGENVSLKVQQRAESAILAKAVARSIHLNAQGLEKDWNPFSDNNERNSRKKAARVVLVGTAVAVIGIAIYFAIKKFRR